MASNFTLYALNEGSPPVADAYAWGLRNMGFDVLPPRDEVPADEIHLFFGLPGISWQELLSSAPRAVNVNLEQIAGRNARVETQAGSLAMMRNVPTWDFSRHNIELLRRAGACDIHHVPIGYAPVLERTAFSDQERPRDLDVVCTQHPDAKGAGLLRGLQARGLKVAFDPAGGWSAQQAEEHIARAKLVLVLGRYDDAHVFDETRVGWLLANRVPVVAELRASTLIEDDMRACVEGGPLEALPALCMALAADAPRRQALVERAYATFRQREWLPHLERAAQAYITGNPVKSAAVKDDVAPPRRLNIGSGKSWKYDHFNIDLDSTRGADLVFDLSQPFAFDADHATWRFGTVRLPKDHFDYILAEHVLEHVRELIQCVTTCMEWLCDGGTLEVEVPYDLSYGAWQDPTHLRGFNEKSWLYYTDWCWYVGWREHRFDLVSNVFLYSDLGRELHARGVEEDVILRTPRAVDAMRAIFRKRVLTDAEKEAHSAYFRTVS